MKKFLKIPPPRSGPPDTIGGGRFKIIRQIGEGAAGTVYEAIQVSVDRRVAIKVLQRVHQAQADYKERFSREAKAIARLNHTHCITLFDFGFSEEFDSLYMVTEFVEGRELFDVLADGGLPLREGLRVALQLTEALAHAHDQGILHRDLKPENVLISSNGDAKVLDFGLVRILDTIQSEHGKRLTAQGAVYGTPVYMSPEQCQGDINVSAQTDLYSLGVMLYELVEGRVPFDSKEILKILVAHVQEEPPPFSVNAPIELKRLILQMLEKDPKDRPSSAHEVADQIRDILLGAAVKAGEFSADISQELSRSIMRRAKGALQAQPVAEESPAIPAAPPAFKPATLQLVGLSLAGKYHIGAVLGAGAMGTVFKAVTDDGEPVAVKVLGHGTPEALQAGERFAREAEVLRKLDHPHIVGLKDLGHDEALDRDYIVMEFVTGTPLSKRLESGPLSPEEAQILAVQILEALAAAHAKKVVHRDLKPANIMLADGAKFQIKLLDFGLALISDQTRLTATGDAVGTITYMPPEVLSGKDVDHRADLYAVGAILYEALSGRPPFSGKDPVTLAGNIMTQTAAPLTNAPASFATFVKHLMERERSHRPQTAVAALATARTLLRRKAPKARGPRIETVEEEDELDFAPSKTVWLVPVILLALVAGIAALVLTSNSGITAPPEAGVTTNPVADEEPEPAEELAQPDAASKPDVGTDVNTSDEPAEKATEPVKEPAKPVKEAAKPVKEAAKPVKEAAKPVKEPAKPVKEPTKPEEKQTELPTLEFTP